MIQILIGKEPNDGMIGLLSAEEISALYKSVQFHHNTPPREYAEVHVDVVSTYIEAHHVDISLENILLAPSPDIQLNVPEIGIVRVKLNSFNLRETQRRLEEEVPGSWCLNIGFIEVENNDIGKRRGPAVVAPINAVINDISIPGVGFINNSKMNRFCEFFKLAGPVPHDVDQEVWLDVMTANDVITYSLGMWCAVQHALRNPEIVQVNTYEERVYSDTLVYDGNPDHKISKRAKTGGIKRVYISEAMDNHNVQANNYKRKTVSWYVHGHYRNLPSGERVWIPPYWKGPGRSNPEPTSTEVRIDNLKEVNL